MFVASQSFCFSASVGYGWLPWSISHFFKIWRTWGGKFFLSFLGFFDIALENWENWKPVEKGLVKGCTCYIAEPIGGKFRACKCKASFEWSNMVRIAGTYFGIVQNWTPSSLCGVVKQLKLEIPLELTLLARWVCMWGVRCTCQSVSEYLTPNHFWASWQHVNWGVHYYLY